MKIKLGNVLEINNVLKSIIDNTELKIDALFKFKLLGIMKNTILNNIQEQAKNVQISLDIHL